MTILNCSAVTCIYNKDQLCSRGEIEVMGHDARVSDETSCGSFRDRNSASVTNSEKESCGCEKIRIDCKAHECTYNVYKRQLTTSTVNVRPLPLTSTVRMPAQAKKQSAKLLHVNADTFCRKQTYTVRSVYAVSYVSIKLFKKGHCPQAMSFLHWFQFYLFFRKSGIWISFF